MKTEVERPELSQMDMIVKCLEMQFNIRRGEIKEPRWIDEEKTKVVMIMRHYHPVDLKLITEILKRKLEKSSVEIKNLDKEELKMLKNIEKLYLRLLVNGYLVELMDNPPSKPYQLHILMLTLTLAK